MAVTAGGRDGADAVICLLVFCSAAVFACTCAADEALLRQAWTFRPGPRRDELSAARERLALLVTDWAEAGATAALSETNENARWLLSHRQATYLVVDEQLDLPLKSTARSAMLALTGRMVFRNLALRVAPMLPAAEDNGEQLDILRCLSALQGRASLEALVQFTQSPASASNEATLVEAVRGLGFSRSPEVLPAILQEGTYLGNGGVASLAAEVTKAGIPAVIEAIKPLLPQVVDEQARLDVDRLGDRVAGAVCDD